MHLDESVKSQVRECEAKISTHARLAKRAQGKAEEKRTVAETLYDGMNFRERHLGGYLGGNKSKVKEYNDAIALSAQFNEEAHNNTEQAILQNNVALGTLKVFLLENDAQFNTLYEPYNKAEEMLVTVSAFLGKINSALKEINEAQDMETLDAFSNNVGISLMSYGENQEAKEAIDDVKHAVPDFQKAVEYYQGHLKGLDNIKIDHDIADGMDLAFDFAFGAFDFMSFVTLSALDDAESTMKDVKKDALNVKQSVSSHSTQAKRNVDSYIHQARLACV